VSVQERFVVRAAHPDEFAVGSTVRRPDSRPGNRRLILVAHEDEQRTPHA